MKIIQINVVFSTGSTGKIVHDIDSYIKAKPYDSLVFYGRGKSVHQTGVYKFCTEAEAAVQKIRNRAGALMYGGNPLSTKRLIRRIKKESPDIVHLHCINGFCVNIYTLLSFLANAKIKTVITHHAEFFYTGNCGYALECKQFMENNGCSKCPHPRAATGALFVDRANTAWQKMLASLSKFDCRNLVFTAVSPWLYNRSKRSPIVSKFDCTVIENGLDTSVFKHFSDYQKYRGLIPNCKNRMILHVTASFADDKDTFKGGDRIIELARLMPEISFVIVASYSKISNPLPENVYFFGRTKDQQTLAALYNAADLTVIASKRETFSMVVAESLCCGTPVVGFEAGGPESIAIHPYCKFVSREKGEKGLLDAAYKMMDNNFDKSKTSQVAIKKFGLEVMAEKYCSLYSSLLQN